MGAEAPGYVWRFARLPRVLELLADYPDGLSLDRLAERVGAPVEEVREDLLSFYSADVVEFGFYRPAPALEFLGPDGDEVDPNQAEVVRISGDPGVEELGVQYVTAGELALLFTAARLLQDLEPADPHLASAVRVLAETMYGEPSGAPAPRPRPGNDALGALQEAVRTRRRVRIVYSRAWRSGVSERVIDPYRLVNTRRGWEVDAGPLDADRRMRTYLLANLRDCEVLEDTFLPPDDLDERLARQRETTRVRVTLPQSARWAADMYAEDVRTVVEDEIAVTVDLDLLPPLGHRVGLLLLASGPRAQVVSPAELRSAGAGLARTLLEHHRRTTDRWEG